MVVSDIKRVSRVIFDPADVRAAPGAHPGMHGISSAEPRLPFRWPRAQEAADIPCRDTRAAQGRDHDVAEILTNPMTVLESLFMAGLHRSGLRVETHLPVQGLPQRPDSLERAHIDIEMVEKIVPQDTVRTHTRRPAHEVQGRVRGQ